MLDDATIDEMARRTAEWLLEDAPEHPAGRHDWFESLRRVCRDVAIGLATSGAWSLLVYLHHAGHLSLAAVDDDGYERREAYRRTVRDVISDGYPSPERARKPALVGRVGPDTRRMRLMRNCSVRTSMSSWRAPTSTNCGARMSACGTTEKGVDMYGEQLVRGMAQLMAHEAGRRLVDV